MCYFWLHNAAFCGKKSPSDPTLSVLFSSKNLGWMCRTGPVGFQHQTLGWFCSAITLWVAWGGGSLHELPILTKIFETPVMSLGIPCSILL